MERLQVSASDRALLRHITADLAILADVSRADVLLLAAAEGSRRLQLLAHASPHSSTPLYDDARRQAEGALMAPEVLRGMEGKAVPRAVVTKTVRGATVARQVYSVRNATGTIIAVLVKDAYWLAFERHRRRAKPFQVALEAFTAMVLGGELAGAEQLDPFGEHDGIVYVGPDRRIQYMSGIASELYRHLGHRDSLVGRRVSDLDTEDPNLVARVLASGCCEQTYSEAGGAVWMRKALPVFHALDYEPVTHRLAARMQRSRDSARTDGVLILVHDATETLRAQRERESQMALLREVHHRVKNNLQIVASILRMQARRVTTDEAREVLREGVDRILSVAVVHEFLSQNAKGSINLLEIARRIVGQVEQGLIDPSKRIHLRVSGPDIWLPSERATQCALVVNELVHNAIEHGLADRDEGTVEIKLVDRGAGVSIIVTDNGAGLPSGFDLATGANLGLSLVRSMVERDLRGSFRIEGQYGVQATVAFDKTE